MCKVFKYTETMNNILFSHSFSAKCTHSSITMIAANFSKNTATNADIHAYKA